MSVAMMIYVASLAVIYVATRLLDGHETLQPALVAVGVAGFVSAAVLTARSMRAAPDEGIRLAYRRMLDFFAVAAAGLLVYAASTQVDAQGAQRLYGVLAVTWPALLFVASVVLLVLDHALQASPVVLPRQQVKRALYNALSAAFALALVFPVNYLANRHDPWWDFSYFRTAEPGSATKTIVEQLPAPVTVQIFQPASSEVLPQIRDYFDQLEGPNLRVEVLDQAADPALARALRIRDNGFVAITQGEVDTSDSPDRARPKTQQFKVGTEMEEARPKLKNLDQEVHKALLQFARGELQAYLTVGHGELAWQGDDRNPMRTAKGLKQILDYMNIDAKKLGLTEGLAEGVPEDADVVIVLGADRGFLPAEVDSLKRFVQRGGSLLLAVEPKLLRGAAPAFEAQDHVADLLAFLGLKLTDGVVASTNMVVPLANNKSDRVNVATNRFSSHPSTVVLSQNQEQLRLFTPGAGTLEETGKGEGKTTVTVRTFAQSWLDVNENLEFDADAGESKSARPLAVVAEGGVREKTWRALVVADASLFADLPIGNPGNQQFIYDGLNWLTRQEALSGQVENEEDVRIQHTKEGQAGWFYSTVLGVPLLFLAFGLVRLRLRRRGGAQ